MKVLLGRKKGAFTILEAIITLAVLSISMLSIYRMQMGSIRRMSRWQEEISKSIIVKNELMKYLLGLPKQTKPSVEKKEDPDWTITSELKEISNKSTLSKFSNQISILESEGEWGIEPKRITFITFVATPEKKDE